MGVRMHAAACTIMESKSLSCGVLCLPHLGSAGREAPYDGRAMLLQGISAGMEPPPPAVSVLTSLMCVCLSVWTYASNGRSTAALAVSSFALLSLQLLTVKQLKFSMLASSVFGLFYCGEPRRSKSMPVFVQHFYLSCRCWLGSPLQALTQNCGNICRLSAELLDQAARPVCSCYQQHCSARLAGKPSHPALHNVTSLNNCNCPLLCCVGPVMQRVAMHCCALVFGSCMSSACRCYLEESLIGPLA